jgi:hypothetical protein
MATSLTSVSLLPMLLPPRLSPCAAASTLSIFSQPAFMPPAFAFKLFSPVHLFLPLPHGPLLLGAGVQRFCQPPLVRAAASQQRRQRRRGKPFRCLDVTSRSHAVQQISIFFVAAMLGATCYLLEHRLLLWRRSGKEVDGDRIWKDLRRFSGWMCAGCMTGLVSCAMLLRGRNLGYEAAAPGITPRRAYELRAQQLRHLLSLDFTYPLHLLCVIYALNMLLCRVSDHASHSYYNTARDHVDNGRSSTNKRFDCRDYFGQVYACISTLSNARLMFILLVRAVLLGAFREPHFDSALRVERSGAHGARWLFCQLGTAL